MKEYPFKTREELLQEDTVYPDGCYIQVKGENKRYIADGINHFKDLSVCFDFPDEYEMYWWYGKVYLKARVKEWKDI